MVLGAAQLMLAWRFLLIICWSEEDATARLSVCLILLFLMSAVGATEDDTREAIRLQELVVTGQRNPQTFDYAAGLKILDRFEGLPENERTHVRLRFYVVPKRKNASLAVSDALDMAVDTGDRLLPLEIEPGGGFTIPRLSVEEAGDAMLVSIQPRGSLKVVYKIDLLIPQHEPLTAGWLRTAVAQAKGSWKAVLPRMARKTVPTFQCAEFQVMEPAEVLFSESDQHVSWRASATPDAPAKWPLDSDVSDSARVTIEGDDLRRLAACKN